ncbi:TPA_asm: DUF551 domain-containing protein [Salmonella enterica subsp. enterica]|uniref:DUF551 domain-containing protein n=1 Tax=Salmonella enterica TaxID=28901 RepID=UPI0009A9A6C6|nr:DUF551 domain-containing protein [Salmonella enterica]EDH6604158.1 DUF551 domain-containing protein [Salmonella enterica subsp. enterica serovar Gambia]EDX3163595.1 DUF551 domain-containing protein [Salmonella enterica subsp. enterica]HCB5406792.1 DUF551 domain-containing protein [Salmonella enterica subsp. enterica serovar Ouakam]EBK3240108.1 DUF551 domain-containing protein [Salmonella enterica]EDI6168434.1 DUF551 domain-containing protein [Salmonella enterica]
MTTITKEWLQQTIAEFENTRDDIPFGLSDDDAKILIVLKRALAVIDAEPVRYLNKFSGTCVTLEQQSNAADDVAVYIPLYAAPPVQETGVYKDMLNIISLLENNEWAEHCTSTVLGSLLESEITRLVGKGQPAPVVSFYRDGIEAAASWVDKQRQAFDNEHGRYDSDTGAFEFGNDAQRDYSDTLAELADGIRELHPNARGNSPVIPDGWVSCSERMPENGQECLVQTNSGWRYVSFYDAHSRLFYDSPKGDIEYILVTHWMPLPAAPQQEVK